MANSPQIMDLRSQYALYVKSMNIKYKTWSQNVCLMKQMTVYA